MIFREEEEVRKQIGTIRTQILRAEDRVRFLCTPRFRPLSVRFHSFRKPKVQQIELGFQHTICLVRECEGEGKPRVFVWGSNEFGQLGLGDFRNRFTPCELNMSETKTVACRVAAGYFHSGFVCTEGFAYTFGSSSRHRLGYEVEEANDDDDETSVHTPRRLNVFYSCEYGEARGAMRCKVPCVKSLHLGNETGAVVTSIGEVFTWGSSEALGHGNRLPQVYPLRVHQFRGRIITSASLGDSHAGAVSEDGRLYTWGNGRYGRLGHNNHEETELRPKFVFSFSNMRVNSVSCGHYVTFVVTSVPKGNLYGFGLTDDCRLGREFVPGTKKRQRFVCSPKLVMKGRVQSVSTGLHHSLVLRRDSRGGTRSVYGCGLNTVGQLGIEYIDDDDDDDDDAGIEFERIDIAVSDDDDDDEDDSRKKSRRRPPPPRVVSAICCGAYHSAVALVDDH